MMIDSEIIDISNLSESLDAPMKLSKCGGGLELLMNDKVKENSQRVEMEDINSLEHELNNLVNRMNINLIFLAAVVAA